MGNSIRWILVLPVAIATSVLCYIIFTLVWNITSSINIVPQSDLLSLGLANFGINAFSAGLGLYAGANLGPVNRKYRAAIGVASVYIIAATGLLILGFSSREKLHMSLGWHIWGTIAWVVGVGAGLVAAKNYE